MPLNVHCVCKSSSYKYTNNQNYRIQWNRQIMRNVYKVRVKIPLLLLKSRLINVIYAWKWLTLSYYSTQFRRRVYKLFIYLTKASETKSWTKSFWALSLTKYNDHIYRYDSNSFIRVAAIEYTKCLFLRQISINCL